jgi:hypothetical protein
MSPVLPSHPVDTQRQRMPTLMRQCSGTASMRTRPMSLMSFVFKPMF